MPYVSMRIVVWWSRFTSLTFLLLVVFLYFCSCLYTNYFLVVFGQSEVWMYEPVLLLWCLALSWKYICLLLIFDFLSLHQMFILLYRGCNSSTHWQHPKERVGGEEGGCKLCAVLKATIVWFPRCNGVLCTSLFLSACISWSKPCLY
jgi:hypothetical protein